MFLTGPKSSKKKKKLNIHIVRCEGSIQIEGRKEIVLFQMLLNDFFDHGVRVFSQKKIPVFEKVEFSLPEPYGMNVKGSIFTSQPHRKGKRLLKNEEDSFLYETQIKFDQEDLLKKKKKIAEFKLKILEDGIFGPGVLPKKEKKKQEEKLAIPPPDSNEYDRILDDVLKDAA